MQPNKHLVITSQLPGVLLCLAIALPCSFLGKRFALIGGPVFAIVFGIALTSAFPSLLTRPVAWGASFAPGVKFTSKKLLQAAVVLLGFEMNMQRVLQVGVQSLWVMLFTLLAAFLVALFVGKLLRLPRDTKTLISVGTAICGGSAIAATAPVIGASDEDVASSISTIFLFNIVAVFLFPLLGHAMGMSDIHFGMWAGTAINDTSSVVAAGTTWSEAAKTNVALEFATIVKLTRTLMIVPITLVLAFAAARRRSKEAASQGFRLAKVFPWFVLLFVLAALLNTYAGVPEPLAKSLVSLGKFMIVMAMAAIGLGTNLNALFKSGVRPLLLGLCCWAAVAITSLIVQQFAM